MSANRVIGTGLASIFVIFVFGRQIIHQLQSGKVRYRGSVVDKTREDNPVSFWSGIAVETAAIFVAVYFFVSAIRKM